MADSKIAEQKPASVSANADGSDVAALQRTIVQQQQQIDYLNQIIDSVPGSIYWKDKNGRYLGRNQHSVTSCIELGIDKAGTEKGDIIGKTDFDLLPENVAQSYRENDQIVMAQRKAIQVEEALTDSSGDEIVQLSAKSPMFSSLGEVAGIVGVTLDISKLKQIQRILQQARDSAEDANAAKMQFIRNMEHDLRTPMAGIIGVTTLLMHDEADPKKFELFGDIKNCSERLLEHCDEILRFLLLENNVLPEQFTLVDITDLLAATAAIFKPSLRAKNLRLDLDFSENLRFFTDKQRLKAIVENLLSNAVKFTHDGQIKLSAAIMPDNNLHIKVQDTGIGIADDQKSNIFNRFVRLNESNSGEFDGFGLGLSIVEQMLGEISASINVDSTLGCGSTFTVIVKARD